MPKDYYNNIQEKFVKKGGTLPIAIPAAIPEDEADALRLLVMESYLGGYETAKTKFKERYGA